MIENPAILTDVTRCIGCEECVKACKRINGLPEADSPPRIGGTPDGLSADRWTTVVRKPDNRFVRKQCHHCLEPACVSVCPVGALIQTPEGPVVYDKSLCMGCRYCMLGCPYGIPHYEWSSVAPSVRKCILCYPHLKAGKVEAPACVTACPKEATIFGRREDLLKEAWRRIGSEPSKYIQKVWGEKEVGGTSILMIADISLDFLGWQNPAFRGEEPLPEKTWAALWPVPLEFLGMGALMGAIWWTIERRRQRAAEKAQAGPAKGAKEGSHGE
jgi:formate dehydrogenase iron-sulfur subunit